MERRVLLAIFLSFLVLSVYQTLVVKPAPKRPAPVPANTAAESSPPATPASTAQSPPTPAANPPAERGPDVTPLVSETSDRDVRIETNEVIAVFTNRGARLRSWRLKKFKDAKGEPQELIESGLALPGPAGTLELQPLPFTLKTPDAAISARLNDAQYAATAEASSPNDLRFEYRDSSGIEAVKQFHLDAGSYILTVRTVVRRSGEPVPVTILWGPGLADTVEVSRYSQKPGGLLFQNGKAERLAPKDIARQGVYEGDFGFAGVEDNYFMSVALSVSGVRVAFQPVAIPPAPPSKDPPRELMAYSIEQRPADPLKFFIGPKDFGVLTAVNRDLQNAINFGMFKVIVVPLLQSLKWVNSFVGNYGWSIVVLTILINAIMFPLRHKSTVSMRKMQEIQPEVKAIQDRYAKLKATDPAKQKMNQELMTLYRDRGVNPASGCVPMLLTMPVLLAMWALLQTSIELRGAPWFGWIHDLSAHDPYYVLAVLMGATGFWQQRMMPASGGADPAQQKMMMFMPLMMTVMLAWLPAGALIYYVVTNIWMIGQQYLTNYLIGPPTIRTVRPPAERRLKRAVGGKPEPAGREAE